MSPHRLRRGALHLPIRRSRQNVNLFLREPLDLDVDFDVDVDRPCLKKASSKSRSKSTSTSKLCTERCLINRMWARASARREVFMCPQGA
jgi:hypothetical protein